MFSRNISKCIIITIISILPTNFSYSWGVWGHTHINRAAIFALPIEMKVFYYNHADFITEGAVIPDLRRGILHDKFESPRHFIDIESFNKTTIEKLPRSIEAIYTQYDSTFLQNNGILPWYIQILTTKLTESFRKRNKSEILFLSSELAHYLGDAHVPLHTTINYDGQLTGQKGIHSFWESRIPNALGNSYDFFTGSAIYIEDLAEEPFRIINESHNLLNSLLSSEKELLVNFNNNSLFLKDNKGELVQSYNQPVYSDAFMQTYNTRLQGMVEKQIRTSIMDIANFWYTAWVNAGKPELNSLDAIDITKQNKRNFKREFKKWKKGKLVVLKSDKD